ncbi:hypothetical protein Tco_1114932, partial [Tanacetum coccineum]
MKVAVRWYPSGGASWCQIGMPHWTSTRYVPPTGALKVDIFVAQDNQHQEQQDDQHVDETNMVDKTNGITTISSHIQGVGDAIVVPALGNIVQVVRKECGGAYLTNDCQGQGYLNQEEDVNAFSGEFQDMSQGRGKYHFKPQDNPYENTYNENWKKHL